MQELHGSHTVRKHILEYLRLVQWLAQGWDYFHCALLVSLQMG